MKVGVIVSRNKYVIFGIAAISALVIAVSAWTLQGHKDNGRHISANQSNSESSLKVVSGSNLLTSGDSSKSSSQSSTQQNTVVSRGTTNQTTSNNSTTKTTGTATNPASSGTSSHNSTPSSPPPAQPSTLANCVFVNGPKDGQSCPASAPTSWSYSTPCYGNGAGLPCPSYTQTGWITASYQNGATYCEFDFRGDGNTTGAQYKRVRVTNNNGANPPDCMTTYPN